MIFPYQEGDLKAASVMLSDVFTHEPFNMSFLSVTKAERYLRDISVSPNFRGFRLARGHETAGFCFGIVMDYFSAPYYDIKEIFLGRRYQGMGLGSEIITEIEEILILSGIGVVTLNTSVNIPAYGFYLKNGYGVSADSVHMSKRIM